MEQPKSTQPDNVRYGDPQSSDSLRDIGMRANRMEEIKTIKSEKGRAEAETMESPKYAREDAKSLEMVRLNERPVAIATIDANMKSSPAYSATMEKENPKVLNAISEQKQALEAEYQANKPTPAAALKAITRNNNDLQTPLPDDLQKTAGRIAATSDRDALEAIPKEKQAPALDVMAHSAKISPAYAAETARLNPETGAALDSINKGKEAVAISEMEARRREMSALTPGMDDARARELASRDARTVAHVRDTEKDAAIAIVAKNSENAAYADRIARTAPELAQQVKDQQAQKADEAARYAAKPPAAKQEATEANGIEQVVRDRKVSAPESDTTATKPAESRPRDGDAAREVAAAQSAGQVPKDAKPMSEAEAQQKANSTATVPVPPAPKRENQVEDDTVLTARGGDKKMIPEKLESQFIKVGDKYFDKRDTRNEVFEDKGNRLETSQNSEQAARTMVEIAKSRGWDEIKVTGSEQFRRQAYIEAASNGMDVRGYTPTDADKAELLRREKEHPKERNTVEPSQFRARETATEAGQGKTVADEKNKSLAEQFRKDPMEAAKKNPELVPAVAKEAMFMKQLEKEGMSADQRPIAQKAVRDMIAKDISVGNLPKQEIREETKVAQKDEPKRARNAEQEQSR